MEKLKHHDSIISIFDTVILKTFGPNISEESKENIVNTLLSSINKTMADLNAEIEQGISNGHSVDDQLLIIQQIFK